MSPPSSFYDKIKKGLIDLPGEAAHAEMFPLRAVASEELKTATDYRTSAVLALLFEDQGTKMVLTQRHNYKGTHGGQVSFPGGKMEEIDESTIHTALRETHEEIGVSPNNINVLGKLTDVYIPVSKFLVHPFIGIHEGSPTFELSEREVKEIITFDLELLTQDAIVQKRDIKTSSGMVLKNVPCFIIGDKIVWGATALMLNEIRQILIR